MLQVGKRLFDPRVGLFLGRPAGKLGEPRPGGTARRIQVADDHVVEQDVVQAPRRQLAADQVRVDVQDRHIREGVFELADHVIHHSQDSFRAMPSHWRIAAGSSPNMSEPGTIQSAPAWLISGTVLRRMPPSI